MKKGKIGRWILGALLVIIAAWLFTGKDGLLTIYHIHRKTQRIAADVRRLENMVDSLETEIEKLKTDTTYIEGIAREKLGMAREGEKVYKFIEEKE